MGAVSRGLRNIYRNRVRTFLVIFILGLSISIFISMTQTSTGVGGEATALKARTENVIEMRAAGGTAMGRGVEPLSGNVADEIKGIEHITKIEKYLYVRTESRSEKHFVEIMVGIEPGATLRPNNHGEVGTPVIIAGRNFETGDAGKNLGLIGKTISQNNKVALGDVIDINGTKIEIIGIFDSGFIFGNLHVFMPLEIVQKTFGLEGTVSNIYITVDSVDNVDKVGNDIRRVLGERVDILYGKREASYASDILSSIQASSKAGAVLAALVAGLLVLFTMVLVTRERTKEIGILKAIGASNGDVAKQFVVESLGLALFGGLLGLGIFAVAGATFSYTLLDLPGTSTTPYYGSGGEQPVSTLLSYDISITLILYALGVAFLLGIMGSLYPVLRAILMKPAEAIHYE